MIDKYAQTIEAPDMNEAQKLIGVELTAIARSGMAAQELEMFSTCHTFPLSPPESPYYLEDPRVQITLHTSHGDRAVVVNLRTGNIGVAGTRP